MLKRILSLPLAMCALAGPAHAAPVDQLVDAAKAQVGVTLFYDPAYVSLKYPGGDVPIERGVCTDVVIRAYRKLGIDLQQLVHEDMRAAWPAYRKAGKWGMKGPDRNIDHRRVPNLEVFFRRHGAELERSRAPADYQPGDIVTWMLPGNLPHIGLISDRKSPAGTPLVVHNIGGGARVADMLFDYPITGHFRYLPGQGR